MSTENKNKSQVADTPASVTAGVRREVEWFAQAMEKKLKNNDFKGGWDNCSLRYLLLCLKGEVIELEKILEVGSPLPLDECADIANYAMMIADLANRKTAKLRGSAYA